jgi:putative copper export protein
MNGAMVFLHLLGAAIWTGGLFFVGLVAVASRRVVGERERSELFRVVGAGFLVLGGLAAALLALSGNVLVEDMFGGWDGLGDSEAGDLVVWKTALFAAVLVLAVVHGVLLGPRIRALRIRRIDGEATPREEAVLRRAIGTSTVTQILMLSGSVAILALAADMVS